MTSGGGERSPGQMNRAGLFPARRGPAHSCGPAARTCAPRLLHLGPNRAAGSTSALGSWEQGPEDQGTGTLGRPRRALPDFQGHSLAQHRANESPRHPPPRAAQGDEPRRRPPNQEPSGWKPSDPAQPWENRPPGPQLARSAAIQLRSAQTSVVVTADREPSGQESPTQLGSGKVRQPSPAHSKWVPGNSAHGADPAQRRTKASPGHMAGWSPLRTAQTLY